MSSALSVVPAVGPPPHLFAAVAALPAAEVGSSAGGTAGSLAGGVAGIPAGELVGEGSSLKRCMGEGVQDWFVRMRTDQEKLHCKQSQSS